jgi:hypothetical protein
MRGRGGERERGRDCPLRQKRGIQGGFGINLTWAALRDIQEKNYPMSF